MGLFDQLFGKSAMSSSGEPNIRFGRYDDSSKRPEQYAAWERALDRFAEGRYLDAQLALLEYLYDPTEDNLHWEQHDGYLDFRLYQGSQVIQGRMDAHRVTATARVAAVATPPPAVLRRLLERNYQLRYARFALEAGRYLVVRFDSRAVDGSPYKLYAGLRELATQADKMDDLLIEEFTAVVPSADTLRPLPAAEKAVKFDFLQTSITRTLELLNTAGLRPAEQPGGVAYLLLALCYRLDYLLKPEGGTMDALERIHRIYLAEDEAPLGQKLTRLLDEFVRLRDRSRQDFFSEMYRVRSTFGITTTLNHDAFAQLLRTELDGMDWYADNALPAVAAAIPTYLVGQALFSYALPAPDRDLLHLYFHILENDYFQRLGYPQRYYATGTGTFYPKAIKKALQAIAQRHRGRHTRFAPDPSRLRYTDELAFQKSYLELVMTIDLS